jgi:hypothetical protein
LNRQGRYKQPGSTFKGISWKAKSTFHKAVHDTLRVKITDILLCLTVESNNSVVKLNNIVVKLGSTYDLSTLNMTFSVSDVIKDEGSCFCAERVCLVLTYGVRIVWKNTETFSMGRNYSKHHA